MQNGNRTRRHLVKVVVVGPGPNFSVEDVRSGWVDALRDLGVLVHNFDLGSRIAFYTGAHFEDDDGEFVKPPHTFEDSLHLAVDGLFADLYRIGENPDLIIIVSGFFVPAAMLPLIRLRGIPVVYIFTESPYQDDQQAEWAEYADLSIVNDPQNLSRFPAGTYYQPHSYSPKIHYPGTGVRPVDFSFVGTGYESRRDLFDKVRFDDLNVMFGGNWPDLDTDSQIRGWMSDDPEFCLHNADTADLYRQSKCSANLYRRESNRADLVEGWAMGPREVELAACETFTVRDPRPESDEVFGGIFPTFSDADELSDLVSWWAAHDIAREKRVQQASSVIADRTFENAARRLLSTLTK